MKKIKGLIHYISALEKELNVTIIIKFFVGFLDGDTTILNQLRQFYIHESPFCMSIKEHHHLWGLCLHGIELMKQKLESNQQAYFGCCHAGVGEYVVPIITEHHEKEVVIGAVTVGGFYHPRWSAKKNSLCNKYNLHEGAFDELYQCSVSDSIFDVRMIEEKVSVISEYIGLLCSDKVSVSKEKIKTQFDYNYIIGHAIAYLKKHYKESVSLREVASFCHCSPSYISHNFKRVTGVTLNQYVNQLRVGASKALLKESDMSITDIAYSVGFKDSNYFTKVFSDISRISPNRYRK